MDLTLVILAAGLSSRYGRLKQLAPVGPNGEAFLDYALYDAQQAGVERAVVVIREELETQFRAHLEPRWGGRIPITYAYQRLDDVPVARSVAGRRRKPWGTGHAVLTAATVVHGPFIACNADDFYGADAYRLLVNAFRRRPEVPAVAAYPLAMTLSPSGGVSRGLLTLHPGTRVARVDEVHGIHREGDGIRGTGADGVEYRFHGREPVSTNLWTCVPACVGALREAFERFLADRSRPDNAEFLIGAGVNRWIAAGGRVTAVPASGPWLGITHPGDTPHVQARLRALHAEGGYGGLAL